MAPPFSCTLWQSSNPLSSYDPEDADSCVKDQTRYNSQKPPSPPSSTTSSNSDSFSAVMDVDTLERLPTPPASPKIPNMSITLSQRDLINHQLHPSFSQKYRLIQELGVGGFGIVFTAIRLSDQREVAVKFILKKKVPEHGWIYDEAWGSLVPMEIFILKSISHKNIVEYYETFEDDVYYYLVMELHGTPWSGCDDNNNINNNNNNDTKLHAPVVVPSSSTHYKVAPDPNKTPLGNNNDAVNKTKDPIHVEGSILETKPGFMPRRPSCDLFECIEQYRRFDERQAKYIFKQIIDVVYYMSLQNIFHRDIKDENIVIDKGLSVKLIDFGSAIKVKSGASKFTKFHGTINYAAPEILHGKEYYPEMAEVWSLGVLLYTILYGDAPFQNPEHACYRAPIPPRFPSSPEVLHLLDWMLVKDPKRRARIADIASHPWLHKKEPATDSRLQMFSNTRPKTSNNICSK